MVVRSLQKINRSNLAQISSTIEMGAFSINQKSQLPKC